jgi:hypothetical protein
MRDYCSGFAEGLTFAVSSRWMQCVAVWRKLSEERSSTDFDFLASMKHRNIVSDGNVDHDAIRGAL